MISIIIPTYNRAEYLKEAISSALNQTFKDFEIIVIDDASTDNTGDIVLSFGGRVRYIYQDNKERAAARNRGIRESKGEYVAFLDSDDLWLQEHLQSFCESLNMKKDFGLAFSGSYMMNESGNIISKIKAFNFREKPLKEIVKKFSSGGCNASSCLIRKNLFEKVGYFNEDRSLSGSEDWEMWARLAAETEFVFTGKYTVKIRQHNRQSSINADRMSISMKKSLDYIYANQKLISEIKELKNTAYSSLYAVTAINYYAVGSMKIARTYLKKAIFTYPLCVFKNKYIVLTFLRSIFGARLSCLIRRLKFKLTSKFY